jgi:3',5'-cyclic AMP phosphodiesterase CpdA
MTSTITWVHIGDLHMDEGDGWLSLGRLQRAVAEINGHVGPAADFVFLPGDNANHATAAQYLAITDALAPLRLPYRVIPGDHDFEPGSLERYEAAFSKAHRPEVEVVANHRCIYLDIVSHGAGGPDFRLTMHHLNRLLEELARAEAEGQTPLVFMHAYPGDLAADGDMIARTFADARVAFVDTGHTHYNELLNDGPGDLRSHPLHGTDRGRRRPARLLARHGPWTRAELALQGNRRRVAICPDRGARGHPHGHASCRSAASSSAGPGRDRGQAVRTLRLACPADDR